MPIPFICYLFLAQDPRRVEENAFGGRVPGLRAEVQRWQAQRSQQIRSGNQPAPIWINITTRSDNVYITITQGWGSGFGQKIGSGALYEGRFLWLYWMNILDNFKSLLFCFHSFGVRRSIVVLYLKTNPDPDPVKFGPGPDPDPGL